MAVRHVLIFFPSNSGAIKKDCLLQYEDEVINLKAISKEQSTKNKSVVTQQTYIAAHV